MSDDHHDGPPAGPPPPPPPPAPVNDEATNEDLSDRPLSELLSSEVLSAASSNLSRARVPLRPAPRTLSIADEVAMKMKARRQSAVEELLTAKREELQRLISAVSEQRFASYPACCTLLQQCGNMERAFASAGPEALDSCRWPRARLLELRTVCSKFRNMHAQLRHADELLATGASPPASSGVSRSEHFDDLFATVDQLATGSRMSSYCASVSVSFANGAARRLESASVEKRRALLALCAVMAGDSFDMLQRIEAVDSGSGADQHKTRDDFAEQIESLREQDDYLRELLVADAMPPASQTSPARRTPAAAAAASPPSLCARLAAGGAAAEANAADVRAWLADLRTTSTEDAVNANERGLVPLFYATRAGNAELVRALCDLGASAQWRLNSGDTLLHCAVQLVASSSVPIARVLAVCDALVSGGLDAADCINESSGDTPLHTLCRLAVTLGATANTRDESGEESAPLQLARWLLEHKVDIKHRNASKKTAFSLLALPRRTAATSAVHDPRDSREEAAASSPADTAAGLSFAKFFASGQFADCELLADDGKRFAAHRVVLAAASPVFEATLSGEFRNSDDEAVHVPDITSAALDCLLRHVYSGIGHEVPLPYSDPMLAVELLFAGERFMISLHTACLRALQERMVCDESAFQILLACKQYARQFDTDAALPLQRYTEAFILDNYSNFFAEYDDGLVILKEIVG